MRRPKYLVVSEETTRERVFATLEIGAKNEREDETVVGSSG
jgi:hypothetical protein